ncbi:helix-turn-helix domain-containing protein [Streptomyces sp. NPDC059517]|uniref:helix-turn-helix domain-containing protein n=1 Tax=Streptomyces sp. NPDC059517 TaxID=3346855 RepID=UPI003692E676
MSSTFLLPARRDAQAPAAFDWDEPVDGGPVVGAPYLLTTAVLDGSAPYGPSLRNVHTHADPMVAWSHSGTVLVHTRDAMRRLVPGQGLWLPPGTAHASSVEPGGIGCYTYVTVTAAPSRWRSVTPLRIGRALREMLIHLDVTSMPDDLRLRTQRVLIDMLETDPSPAIGVPVPRDWRIRALAEDVMRAPESDTSLEEWAARHALSVRTVARAFGDDIGMPFTRWRSLVRMSAATGLLAGGHSVNLVAHRCGYSTTSAFSAAFRRVCGMSPTVYVRGGTRGSGENADA